MLNEIKFHPFSVSFPSKERSFVYKNLIKKYFEKKKKLVQTEGGNQNKNIYFKRNEKERGREEKTKERK